MLPAWVRVWTDSSSITSEADGTAPITAPQLSVRSHRKLPKGSEYAVQIQGSVEVLEAGAALTPSFQTSDTQSSERINFYGLKPSSLWSCVITTRGNECGEVCPGLSTGPSMKKHPENGISP